MRAMKIGIPVYDGVGMLDIAGALYMCLVCKGAMLLAASGRRDDQWATTHWAFLKCSTALFPKVKVAEGHARLVLDRHRLTGGGISAGRDEALMLITLLAHGAGAPGAAKHPALSGPACS
ncbi:hypothetical protein [Bradyrhizobium sp. NAS80.1]|uniref:hypothetical protein n=1 Tax=Bradyrhizobium sp. NAS80.1 TaxID=1680159 RepID=UPI001FD8F0A5|nr:hypothetical protein [Bradyrhizobium sp. NAS80.1]